MQTAAALLAHGGLSTRTNPAWHENPDNAANGGPCAQPTDFWTHPEAQEHYRHKLRYLVARYGDSPSVFAWEFWNEVNYTDEDELYIGPIRDWHVRMSAYLRGLDPYGHLITTSGAAGDRHDLIDPLPGLDFVQTHQYGLDDTAEAIRRLAAGRPEGQDKPHLFGELGVSASGRGLLRDPDAVHIHNLLWAGLFTDTPATAMSWWWDNYIEPQGLWRHLGPVARFMEGVPVAAGPTRPLTPQNLRVDAASAQDPTPRPLRVTGSHSVWEPHPANRPHALTVNPDGRVDGGDTLSSVMHGMAQPAAIQNPVTFTARYLADGLFTVEVTEVSGRGGAGLRIAIDGVTVLEETFADRLAMPSWESTHDYDGRYSVAVPAGDRVITVENAGQDWMRVGFELSGPVTTATPWLDVHARAIDGAAVGEPAVLAWFRNRDAAWGRVISGDPPRPAPATTLELVGVDDGDYQIQWWDTRKGQATPGATVTARHGRVALDVPEVGLDLAARLIRKTPAPVPAGSQPVPTAEPAADPDAEPSPETTHTP